MTTPQGERQERNCTCEVRLLAMKDGTDNLEESPLLTNPDPGMWILGAMPPVSYCPWCGRLLEEAAHV